VADWATVQVADWQIVPVLGWVTVQVVDWVTVRVADWQIVPVLGESTVLEAVMSGISSVSLAELLPVGHWPTALANFQ
jgi:hypothetical protein